MTGTIKKLQREKGFGFIIPEGGGDDVFIHKTVVIASGNPDLRDGMKVTFVASPSPRTGKMQARSVALA